MGAPLQKKNQAESLLPIPNGAPILLPPMSTLKSYTTTHSNLHKLQYKKMIFLIVRSLRLYSIFMLLQQLQDE